MLKGRRFSPAMIVAMIALAVALSGTAVAGTTKLITGSQIANGTIRLADMHSSVKTALKGQIGAAGAQGLVGAQGAQGLVGPQGATGAKGDAGAVGVSGAKGDKGDTGLKGDKGDKGDVGADRRHWPSGACGHRERGQGSVLRRYHDRHHDVQAGCLDLGCSVWPRQDDHQPLHGGVTTPLDVGWKGRGCMHPALLHRTSHLRGREAPSGLELLKE